MARFQVEQLNFFKLRPKLGARGLNLCYNFHMDEIKHVWLDFSDTIVFTNPEIHDKLKYETYSSATGKPVSPELIQEYETLFKKYKSNSGVFTSLGLDSGYWSKRISLIDPKLFFKLAENCIPDVLEKLSKIVPISIWSNIHVEKILPEFNINPKWFTNIIGPDLVKNPKPALDGFHIIIERSKLQPKNILFVGDNVLKEMLPAKSLGIKTALMWDSTPGADYTLKSFKDILKLVSTRLTEL